MWYVYFLKLSNSEIYVGSTNNITRRMAEHERGDVNFTKPFRPIHLKAYVAVETQNHARSLEKYYKTGSGKAYACKRFLNNT